MNRKTSPQSLLQQIAQIQHMERGKLCIIREGPEGPYYNHQTWENGRNVVGYVPRQRVTALQKAIDGYQQYLKLTKAYADAVIRRTRQRQAAKSLGAQKHSKNQ